jgi:hypothetical protein
MVTAVESPIANVTIDELVREPVTKALELIVEYGRPDLVSMMSKLPGGWRIYQCGPPVARCETEVQAVTVAFLGTTVVNLDNIRGEANHLLVDFIPHLAAVLVHEFMHFTTKGETETVPIIISAQFLNGIPGQTTHAMYMLSQLSQLKHSGDWKFQPNEVVA